MATKTGILSDANFMANCEMYKPLPIGYANAHFDGNQPNPNLLGIKTPKYQRAAPRPVSADVLAINMARMEKSGDSFASAREMLDMYIKEGKEFKPSPINLSAEQSRLDEYTNAMREGGASQEEIDTYLDNYYKMASGPAPKLYTGSLGEKILKQTIATQSDPQPDFSKYRDIFFAATGKSGKLPYYNRMRDALRIEGVDLTQYIKAKDPADPTQIDMAADVDRMFQAISARGVVIDLDKVFMAPQPARPASPLAPASAKRPAKSPPSQSPESAQSVPPSPSQAGTSGTAA